MLICLIRRLQNFDKQTTLILQVEDGQPPSKGIINYRGACGQEKRKRLVGADSKQLVWKYRELLMIKCRATHVFYALIHVVCTLSYIIISCTVYS